MSEKFTGGTGVCNKPHEIDPAQCAFCEIERLRAELAKMQGEEITYILTPRDNGTAVRPWPRRLIQKFL